MAIEWVSDNIKQFGGDTNRITLLGQSAGKNINSIVQFKFGFLKITIACSTSTHLHVLNPGARKLFQRAAMFSGAAVNTFAYNDNPQQNDLLFKYGENAYLKSIE